MRRIAVFGNDSQDEYLSRLEAFFRIVRHEDVSVGIESGFGSYLEENGVETDGMEFVDAFPEDSDLVVSFGGDGTFLRAAAWVGDRHTPIMGINTGHLGYLAGFSLADPGEVLDALRGRYDVSPRITLRVDSGYLPEGFSPFALNDIAIVKGDTTSMVSIDAYADGHYLADYQADGLVVSTPTGSTAYNLSCGGPILQPGIECFVLSPIAPHSLTLRPLVIGADSELVLHVSSRGEMCHVGVDGRTFSVPADGSTLLIRRAPFPVNVVQPAGVDFPEVLRKKLRWGEMPLRNA